MIEKPVIVVIDDEKNIADFFYRMIVGHFNYDVCCKCFYYSQEVIDYAKENRVDLIVCDIDMPMIDGINLVKAIRKFNQNLEVIFLTGLNNFNNAYQALQIENVSYILKIDAEDSLISTVENKLNKIEHIQFSNEKIQTIKEENNSLQEKIINEELKSLVISNKKSKDSVSFIDSYIGYINVSEANLNLEMEKEEILQIIKNKLSIKIGELLSINDYCYFFLFHNHNFDELDDCFKDMCQDMINKFQISTICLYTDFIVKIDEFHNVYKNLLQYSNSVENIDSPFIIERISKDNMKLQQIEENNNQLDEIRKYIWDNLSNDVSLNSIAKHLHYNPSYLSRYFKNKYQVNIKDFILEIKIKKAKHLLEDTDLFVKDISQSLGFDSISHFFRVFKKFTNLTPSEYRAKYYKK